jgi:hypothetical protein
MAEPENSAENGREIAALGADLPWLEPPCHPPLAQPHLRLRLLAVKRNDGHGAPGRSLRRAAEAFAQPCLGRTPSHVRCIKRVCRAERDTAIVGP